MKREALKALVDKVLRRNNQKNKDETKPVEGMRQKGGAVPPFILPKTGGGKCKLSCFFWEASGGGWWAGTCKRRGIKVSHAVTWCPDAEALTGRFDTARLKPTPTPVGMPASPVGVVQRMAERERGKEEA